MEIILNNRKIGSEHPVFMVAEISANHGQNFNKAVRLIQKASECGADAVKFQTYTPDTLTLDLDDKYFQVEHPEWGGQTLYQLYNKTYTPWNWFKKLKEVAEELDMIFFSTAFDKTSVDLLEEIGVPIHKISSFELVDIPLIKYTAKTKKPMIISTGMASESEIKDAVAAARKNGAKDIILMKCVSSYPAQPEDMNLNTIPHMSKKFRCIVGLSDHTLGTDIPLTSVSLGAKIIEKHFTLSRDIQTHDSFFSIEPSELKKLVDDIRAVEKAIGTVHYGATQAEKGTLMYRRSLFAVSDIQKGDVFTDDNIRSIRPANGIEPKYLKKILGKEAVKNIKKGTPLKWKLIK